MSAAPQQPELPLHRRVWGLFFSKLARASLWLFVGGIAGGILGYVYQVLMGRMLSTQEYGLFSAMMALFTVFAAPLGTLMMVISRRVSEYRARQDSGSVTHFYYSINIRTAVVGALILSVSLFFAPQIQSYLKAPSVIPVCLLVALLFLTFLPIINNAFLQGLQSFAWLSASGSLGVLLKIIFSVALVRLGYGVAGALGGTILASLAICLITYGALYDTLAEGQGKPFQTTHVSFKSALPVLVTNAAFAAMTQLDMVLVNYYFPPHEAGLYAAASILGKAVMYLPGGIAMALFPMVAENHARDESSAHLLFQSVGLTALLCGAGAIFYFLFGEWIIVLLYGESYQGAGDVLKLFGFAIFPMALVMVAVNFYIAEGRVLFAYLFVFVAPLQLTAFYFYHESLQMVVAVMGASGLILALLGYGLLWRAFRKS
jgi:O-antigen/teichoic acid export membrane protein